MLFSPPLLADGNFNFLRRQISVLRGKYKNMKMSWNVWNYFLPSPPPTRPSQHGWVFLFYLSHEIAMDRNIWRLVGYGYHNCISCIQRLSIL